METKLFLGEITCALTRSVAVGGGPYLVEAINNGGVGDNFDLETDQITVGWKKVGPKWVNTFAL